MTAAAAHTTARRAPHRARRKLSPVVCVGALIAACSLLSTAAANDYAQCVASHAGSAHASDCKRFILV